MESIHKTLYILWILSPLFITGIAAGLLLNKGIKIVQHFALYWLVLSLVFLILWLWALLDHNATLSTHLFIGTLASNAFSIYLSMSKKGQKRK